MNEKTGKLLVMSIISAVTILFLTLLIIVVVQLFTIGPLKRQQAELQSRYDEIIARQNYTENAIDYVEGNKFIEEYAREVLGYGKPGETKYVAK